MTFKLLHKSSLEKSLLCRVSCGQCPLRYANRGQAKFPLCKHFQSNWGKSFRTKKKKELFSYNLRHKNSLTFFFLFFCFFMSRLFLVHTLIKRFPLFFFSWMKIAMRGNEFPLTRSILRRKYEMFHSRERERKESSWMKMWAHGPYVDKCWRTFVWWRVFTKCDVSLWNYVKASNYNWFLITQTQKQLSLTR